MGNNHFSAIIITIFLTFFCGAVLIISLLALIRFKKAKNKSPNQINFNNDSFINIIHELKTPLSIISGTAQLIEMKSVDKPHDCSMNVADITKYTEIIKVNCHRLQHLTNNLLTLGKIDAGYYLLKPTRCNLGIFLNEIVQSVIPYAAYRQLGLRYDGPDESLTIYIDTEKMERVMLNLLSNAIKFTEPGGQIRVTCYSHRQRAYISVKDTGVGIPQGKLEEIFSRYKQAGLCPSIENQGCGIGLSLVRAFVNLHNGDINIISEPGKGSEFILDLPLENVDRKNKNTDEIISGLPDYRCQPDKAASIEFSTLSTAAGFSNINIPQ